MKFIKIFLLLILFLSNNMFASDKMAIISSDFKSHDIENIIDNLIYNYKIKIYYVTDNSNSSSYIHERILEYKPSVILLVGDIAISKFSKKNFHSIKMIYCCNFKTDYNLNISGIGYNVNFYKLINLMRKLDNIYVLKTNTELSNILTGVFFENIKSHKIKVVNIKSLYELRMFYVKTSENSIFIDLIYNLNESDVIYNNEYIAMESILWNKKLLNIGLNIHENHAISLFPNYDLLTKSILRIINSITITKEEITLDIYVNMKRLNTINKENFYFDNYDLLNFIILE